MIHFLLVCLLLSIPTNDQVFQMQFDVTTITQQASSSFQIQVDEAGKIKEIPGKESELPKPTTKKYSKSVLVGKDFFEIVTPDSRTRYDMIKNQVIGIVPEKKEYSQTSVQALVLFRGMELQNRQYLSTILNEALKDKTRKSEVNRTEDPRDLEATFGILIKDLPRAEPAETHQKQATTFHIDNKVKVEYTPSGDKVPPEFQAAFRLWLTHTASIHPAIRNRILDKQFVPRHLKWKTQSGAGYEEHDWKLIKVSLAQVDPFSVPAGFRLLVDDKDPVSVMLSKASDRIRKHQRMTPPEIEAAMKKAVEAGRPLDAFLLAINDGLSYSDSQAAQNLRKLNVFQSENEQLKSFTQTFGNRKSEKESIEILEKIDRTGLNYGYVLETQLGGMKMQNASGEAKGHYLKAIEANPHLTGAYVDLGKVLQSMYRTPDAWKCWELARQIDPKHGMVLGVLKLEKQLFEMHPEFFLSKMENR
ncbi:MAG: hypothetical protein JNJ77_04195 [Planctomycetia bacterium]|nr:hypothetical protein [Planctomycetia bacterium]